MRPIMDDLPHLFEELMAFVAVVDAAGFNAAGNRFGVPPSRLSRSLKDAVAAASDSQGEPSGLLRVSCPMALASSLVGGIAFEFMARFPRVSISIERPLRKGSALPSIPLQPPMVRRERRLCTPIFVRRRQRDAASCCPVRPWPPCPWWAAAAAAAAATW
jgi:hypothetical protein